MAIGTEILTTKRCDMGYCPGCSHAAVLEAVSSAIKSMGRSPEQVCLVTDIGCVGLADRYFTCHTFHGLHGRALTYAEGIQRVRPDLLVIVLIGDGGCGIGSAHLIHTARRGLPIKVLVCNNFNFGMTGGQASPTTPPETMTSTTWMGAFDRPMDICGTVMVNGASHVARCSALDRDCPQRIEAALRAPGFALVDIWELCVAYFVERNKVKPASLHAFGDKLSMPFGLLRDEPCEKIERPPGRAGPRPMQPTPSCCIPWNGRMEICMAGSAGQHVRAAMSTLGEIAVAGGLFVTQEDDFPITVRKGHSLSRLVICENPIRLSGQEDPDVLIVLSEDGLKRVGPLRELPTGCHIYMGDPLKDPELDRIDHVLDLKRIQDAVGRDNVAMVCLGMALFERRPENAHSILETAETVVRGPRREATRSALHFAAALAQVPSESPAIAKENGHG